MQQWTLQELHQCFKWLIENDPRSLEAVAFTPFGGARKNDKRPAYLSLYVPDDWNLNVFGKPELRDQYFLVRMDQARVNEWAKEVEEARDVSVVRVQP